MYRYQPLLFQPVPSVLPYSLSELVEEVRATHFPDLLEQVEVRFAAEGPLAYMAPGFMGAGRHMVVFHPVLNHPHTPVEVLRFGSKHELLHLVIPGESLGGRYISHPPEFWAREAEIGPERYAAWAWIRGNLGRCARRGSDGYRVDRRWRRLTESPRTPYTPSLPFNGERWDHVCPGDGAQLQLPPDWAARPMPLAPSGRSARPSPVQVAVRIALDGRTIRELGHPDQLGRPLPTCPVPDLAPNSGTTGRTSRQQSAAHEQHQASI